MFSKKNDTNKTSKNYGAEFSLAFTIDENGHSSIGLTAKDSDGMNLDRHLEGDDILSLVNTLADGVSKEIADQKKSKKVADKKAKLEAEKKARADKRAEIQKQKDDIEKQLAGLRDQLRSLDALDARADDDFRILTDTTDFAGEFDAAFNELNKIFKNLL